MQMSEEQVHGLKKRSNQSSALIAMIRNGKQNLARECLILTNYRLSTGMETKKRNLSINFKLFPVQKCKPLKHCNAGCISVLRAIYPKTQSSMTFSKLSWFR